MLLQQGRRAPRVAGRTRAARIGVAAALAALLGLAAGAKAPEPSGGVSVTTSGSEGPHAHAAEAGRASRGVNAGTTQEASDETAAVGDDVPVDAAELTRFQVALDRVDPQWWRGGDLMITGHGDDSGYHVYVGRENERYSPRPLATIQPGGYGNDDWLGYQCLTGDTRHVLVTLLPRRAVNVAATRDRGAVLYSVDVVSGKVRPVLAGVAFKYHALGCGSASQSVVLRHLGSDQERTEILSVDPAKATARSLGTFQGQLTSAVPDGEGALALKGRSVVSVRPGSGRQTRIARLSGDPFELRTTAAGRAEVLVADGTKAALVRVGEDGGQRLLARGALNGAHLFGGARGVNVAVGLSAVSGVRGVQVAAAAGGARGSSAAGKVVWWPEDQAGTSSTRAQGRTQHHHQLPGAIRLGWVRDGSELGVRRSVESPRAAVTAVPGPAASESPATRGAAGGAARVMAQTPVCAVPRNVPNRLALGAVNGQADWAVQQAVRELLKGSFSRPAGYLRMGLPAYSPSTDFDPPALAGPTATIPPAVMNGVLAQESGYRHASRRTLPGSGGNPVISDYYGAGGTLSVIDYSNADCGYGIAQVTDGMRADSTSLTANGKIKVAVDYAENIAAGVNILAKKWNELYAKGIRLNDSDARYVENWYLALWSYNSGLQPNAANGNPTGCSPSPGCTDADGNWGLGWTNNPMNPDYPPSRTVFLRESYADAERPGDWPYQERVLGWTETPIKTSKGTDAYSPAQPANSAGTPGVVVTYPPRQAFCDADSDCDPLHDVAGTDDDFCLRADNHCWFHKSLVLWNCQVICATSSFSVGTTAPEPSATNPFPPSCNSGLPAAAVIVDELADPAQNIFCPNRDWTSRGTFAYVHGTNSAGDPLAEIDFHQAATGLGAHTFFAGNRLASDTAHLVTGTWTPSNLSSGTYLVKAHIPTSGASAPAATYRITKADGTVASVTVNQHEHWEHWKSLGAFALGPNAKVVLTNVTGNTAGGQSTVAWDAMAFVPIAGTPVTKTVDAVALFSENQDLDTSWTANRAGWLTGNELRSRQNIRSWSTGRVSEALSYVACGSTISTGCLPTAVLDTFRVWGQQIPPTIDPVNHPAGVSLPLMLNLANKPQYKPTSPSMVPAWSANDPASYKIRSRMTFTYTVNNGRIVEGSTDMEPSHRTGDTHLPDYALSLLNSVASGYGIPKPNLTYSLENLRIRDHSRTTASPQNDGIIPGRGYRTGTRPATITDGGTCVGALYTSGGSIGYRVLASVAAVSDAFDAYVARVKSDSRIPGVVKDTLADTAGLFFNDGVSSGFAKAPPIWNEVNLKVCLDGTVRPVSGAWNGEYPILRQSYMPDAYLYYNGNAMRLDGTRSTSSAPFIGPVLLGRFQDFSSLLQVPGVSTPYGDCNLGSARGGNPWSLDVDATAAIDPTNAHPCAYPDEPFPEEFG